MREGKWRGGRATGHAGLARVAFLELGASVRDGRLRGVRAGSATPAVTIQVASGHMGRTGIGSIFFLPGPNTPSTDLMSSVNAACSITSSAARIQHEAHGTPPRSHITIRSPARHPRMQGRECPY